MAYEIAFIFGLFSLSYFLIFFSDAFKIDGSNAKRALLNGLISLTMRLMSVATVIYSVFFMRLILQDQIQTTAISSVLTLYDTYLSLFLYGFCVLFFILYFIQQFVILVENFKINKENAGEGHRKYG